jgi:regulator of sirC expression with transglutaminase-like and TPR domain
MVMAARERIRADFTRMVKRPEPALDLARAALLVAAEADPNVDVDGTMRTLDGWAEELRARLDPEWNNLQKLARLRRFLFDDLGFRGDHTDYYSPRNSLLHDVIQRRRGIPLTLSIIFMELGWRLGIPFEGVGFPGHFLVRLAGEPRDLLLDPYNRGMSVHEEDCRRMLQHLSGGRLSFDGDLIASVSKRDMIARLLLNLKGAYLRTNEDEQALAAVDRLLVIHPEDVDEVRDRGLLLYRLQRYHAAHEALHAYLNERPEAPDRATIERHLESLRRLMATMN